MSAPVGPTGCSATIVEKQRPFSLGVSYGFSDTRLIFTDGARYRIRQSAYTLSFLATLKGGLVLGGAVGALGSYGGGGVNQGGSIDGLRDVDERWVIRPGVVWALTVARRFFGTKPHIPYLLVIGTFSGSSASTRRVSDGEVVGLHALDAKADLSVGWTLGDAWSPYVAVRAFGGPIFWKPAGQAVTGGDLYHVSVACGFNLSVANRVALYFDGAFVGMRSLSGGAALRF